MSELVSNEVWRQLDPFAGQLPRRTVWRLRAGITGAVVLAIVAGVVWWTGLIVPRLGWASSDGLSWETGPGYARFEVHIANDGRVPVQVVAVGRSGPGFELTEVRGTIPTSLAGGEILVVNLAYRITDCDAVPSEPWPVPVRIRRPWGDMTSYISIPPQTPPHAAPDGMRQYTGRDPYALEWQDALAETSCHPFG